MSYLSDRDQGHEDYWQAATQTLRIGTGDYEDLSILAVSILNAMGYDCVFILEPQVRFGVDMECPDGVDGFYYHTELDGSEYTSVNIMLRDPFDCAVREIKLVPDWFEGPSHPVQQEVERWSGSS